ncbi:MAG: 1,4-dihydroxy-2-naphthoyl-CoA synthase [Bacteriovoracaceae bacterium]|nr:1,4-dihydroxy-2-naphthoyl-CoA synthase [Bacteriovoracaceae bacterium]
MNAHQPELWNEIKEFSFHDITLHQLKNHHAIRIAFNRPDIRNAFRPQTVDELLTAFHWAQEQTHCGVILLTGNGPSSKDGVHAFCAGGDQTSRGPHGYEYKNSHAKTPARLHILEVQRLIRFMPKVVIAVVNGWAVGGGHSLHCVCDLSLASKEHAIFKQTDPDVASFDGGFGSAYLARLVGQKKAREIFFLGKNYSAQEAFDMGMVNEVVSHEQLENRAIEMANTIAQKSPTAIKMLKFGFNLIDDGLIGQQVFAGEATRLAYAMDEAKEGRDAFLEKRDPRFENFPWQY